MKAKTVYSDKQSMEDEKLFLQYSELKPQFSNKAAARDHYSRELEAVASRHNSTVENLISFVDRKHVWSEEDRYFMRLSRLFSALR